MQQCVYSSTMLGSISCRKGWDDVKLLELGQTGETYFLININDAVMASRAGNSACVRFGNWVRWECIVKWQGVVDATVASKSVSCVFHPRVGCLLIQQLLDKSILLR